MSYYTLHHLTQEVVQQLKQYECLGTKAWTYETAVKDLPCQVGTLTKLMMQLHGERYAHGKSKEELINGIGDELADILSLVLFIAHELNIDLESAWRNMIKSDQLKWATRSSNENSLCTLSKNPGSDTYSVKEEQYSILSPSCKRLRKGHKNI